MYFWFLSESFINHPHSQAINHYQTAFLEKVNDSGYNWPEKVTIYDSILGWLKQSNDFV